MWRHPANYLGWLHKVEPPETLEIAQDVARKLIELRREHEEALPLPTAADQQDYTIVVAA
jgi:hypothetical protein